MVFTTFTPLVAALIAFCGFSIFLLLAFTVAYAKRDVHIEVTLFEFH
jgi:hypothetical protein